MSLIVGLNWASKEIHQTAINKGFWDWDSEHDLYDKICTKLALVHSEVTETLEALRKRQGPDKVSEEITDIIIRCLDLHAALVNLGFATDDIARFIDEKMRANAQRPMLHGRAFG